tara:strand:+ start:1030 stop:1134 length:105 start_codon:yes stop_codon:yes gene_type:complete
MSEEDVQRRLDVLEAARRVEDQVALPAELADGVE